MCKGVCICARLAYLFRGSVHDQIPIHVHDLGDGVSYRCKRELTQHNPRTRAPHSSNIFSIQTLANSSKGRCHSSYKIISYMLNLINHKEILFLNVPKRFHTKFPVDSKQVYTHTHPCYPSCNFDESETPYYVLYTT